MHMHQLVLAKGRVLKPRLLTHTRVA